MNIGTNARTKAFQEKLKEKSLAVIPEFKKKFDDKTDGHDEYVSELKRINHALKAQNQT